MKVIEAKQLSGVGNWVEFLMLASKLVEESTGHV